ncbi:zf-HC2 domain-containing protein [Candidatus Poribacteria bacterium]|nr:zf-HC2 domain-containing protein [Candidatus Poribacteria bacterium]MYH80599.1 zf-HC2 domain-containing protein [Candidatus Poribacteria bacterium]MYK96703.1 zf-HC2 domain-containing protein [Candidatus Poribacteria bacterium]
MNCLQAEEHFSAHFEDTLDYQTLQGFEGHLAECEACQHEYVRFQESVKAVQQLPQIEPSPYFMSTLQQRLATEERDPRSLKGIAATGWKQLLDVLRRPKWAFSGIMALILAATGIYFYQEGPLFNQDSHQVSVSPTSEKQQIVPLPEAFPSAQQSRRLVGDNSQLQQRSILSTPTRPTQQRYMLKQVSYTNASTSGGL